MGGGRAESWLLGLGTEVKRSLGNHLLVLVLLADQASANLALEVHNGLLGRLLIGGGLCETEEGGAVVGAAFGFWQRGYIDPSRAIIDAAIGIILWIIIDWPITGERRGDRVE